MGFFGLSKQDIVKNATLSRDDQAIVMVAVTNELKRVQQNLIDAKACQNLSPDIIEFWESYLKRLIVLDTMMNRSLSIQVNTLNEEDE